MVVPIIRTYSTTAQEYRPDSKTLGAAAYRADNVPPRFSGLSYSVGPRGGEVPITATEVPLFGVQPAATGSLSFGGAAVALAGSQPASTGRLTLGSAPIAFSTHGTTLEDGADQSSYSLASRTYTAGNAYLLVVSSSGFNEDPLAATPSGFQPAYTSPVVQNTGSSSLRHRIQIFIRVEESGATEGTTINFETGASSCVAYTVELTSTGSFEANNLVVQSVAQVNASATTTNTVTLADADSANNAVFHCATWSTTGTPAAEADYTLGEGDLNPASPNATHGYQWRANVADLNPTLTNDNSQANVGVALELGTAGGGGGAGGGSLANLQGILTNMVGYADHLGVSGGTELYTVTNANDSGTGSLRAGCEAGNKWIVFDDDYEITLQTPVNVASNTTIDGRDFAGNYRVINTYGKGFWLNNDANVIFHNLYIKEVTGSDDGIQANGSSTTVWAYHCSIGDPSYLINDGHFDIADNAKGTVQECYFRNEDELPEYTAKAMLVGNDATDTNTLVTIYRCVFTDIDNRNPFCAGGKAHIVDTIVRNWGTFGSAAARGGHILADGFMADKSTGHVSRAITPWEDSTQSIRVLSFWGRQGSESYTEANTGSIFTPPYTLNGSTPNQSLYDSVEASAGRRT